MPMAGRCEGSYEFPTNYDGEFIRCDHCNRTLNLGADGRIPRHNVKASKDYRPASTTRSEI